MRRSSGPNQEAEQGAIRARVVLLTMGLVSGAATLISMLVLYSAGAHEQRSHLESLAKSQAELIDAVARFDATESQDANPAGAWVATLSQVAEGHAQWRQLNTSTSLLIIGKRAGQLVTHVRDGQLLAPDSPAFDAARSAAMRLDVLERGGTQEFRDAQGTSWFESYAPIPSLHMAVLARLNLDVLNRPLRQALYISGAASLLLIALGTLLVRRTSVRTVHELSRELQLRRLAEAKLAEQQERLEHAVAERTTELQQVHAALVTSARFATLGQVTAKVSHELRNPLATIRASLHALQLRLGDQAANVAKILDRLQRNVVRCDRIIEELLTYTRPRGPAREWIEVSAFMNVLLEDYKPTETVPIVSEVAENLRLFIDPEDLRRMLINLLNNAVDASTERAHPVKIHVTVDVMDLVFRVEDQGTGMTSETLARATEAMFSTKNFGIGLGLSIVKELAERNGGSLALTSRLGAGTSAWLRFRQSSKGDESPSFTG